jgi:predicted aconitase with swiveling domain
MRTLLGRGIIGGKGRGEALVTRMPINFAAAHITLGNILWPSRNQDRHHELYGQDVKGRILVMPTCVGSTYSGIVLQGLITRRVAPAAIVTQNADSFIVSGVVFAEVWFDMGLPVVEYREPDLFDLIHNGDRVEVDADTGEVRILAG